MALLFMDSFDHYAAADCAKKWSGGASAIGTTSTTYGRFGSKGTVRGGGNLFSPYFTVSGTVCIVGAAIQRIAGLGGNSSNSIFCPRLGTAIQCWSDFVNASSDNRMFFLDADNNTYYTTKRFPLDTWYFVEWKCNVRTGTNGSIEIRVNGETVLTQSGIDTANSGTDGWDNWLSSIYDSNRQQWWDDVYILDGSGSHANDFLGDCRVEGLIASAGNGSNTGLTCSTGTDHGELVNEATPNTTDYCYGSTVGLKDTYNLPSLQVASGTVYGVQSLLYAAKSDSATRSVCPVWRPSSTDYDGTSSVLSTTYTYYREVAEHVPDGGTTDWTISAVNALELGAKVAA